MGVYIKNMGMPKTCNDCLICCEHSMLYKAITDRRSPKCPLIPAADVREVVRGEWGYRWKINGDGRRPTELFPCSECGFENTGVTNFCPNCGAQMEVNDADN